MIRVLKRFERKTIAVLAALGLALAMLFAVTPAVNPNVETSSAEASWGTSARVNHGIPYGVILQDMNGRIFTAYPNVTYTNIKGVYLFAHECLSIGGYAYCAGSSPRWQYIYQQKVYQIFYVV